MYLFLALVAVPIIEIALFIQVGGLIGMVPTLVIVVITALVGTILLRGQGVATLTNLQSAVARGSNPLNEIAHGAFILVAGVLLLTPGFFTDALGISFLIPPVRSAIIRFLSTRVKAQVVGGTANQTRNTPPDDIVEGDYTVVEPKGVEPEFDTPSDPTARPQSPSGWTKDPSKNDQ